MGRNQSVTVDAIKQFFTSSRVREHFIRFVFPAQIGIPPARAITSWCLQLATSKVGDEHLGDETDESIRPKSVDKAPQFFCT